MSDDDLDDVMITCALRFDGYRYEEQSGRQMDDLLDAFLKTLRLDNDERANQAAFFLMQRYLYKWGGERLDPHSRERQAFRMLFLHLYRVEVEPADAMADYLAKWCGLDRAVIEGVAARVREHLVKAPPRRKSRA